jgi:hypothetical protein
MGEKLKIVAIWCAGMALLGLCSIAAAMHDARELMKGLTRAGRGREQNLAPLPLNCATTLPESQTLLTVIDSAYP